MRVGAVNRFLAIGVEEGLDVVADEDALVGESDGAVELCFVGDGVEEADG